MFSGVQFGFKMFSIERSAHSAYSNSVDLSMMCVCACACFCELFIKASSYGGAVSCMFCLQCLVIPEHTKSSMLRWQIMNNYVYRQIQIQQFFKSPVNTTIVVAHGRSFHKNISERLANLTKVPTVQIQYIIYIYIIHVDVCIYIYIYIQHIVSDMNIIHFFMDSPCYSPLLDSLVGKNTQIHGQHTNIDHEKE